MYKTILSEQTYEFRSIKEILGKASEEKSGDKMTGIQAETALERMAAKLILSELQLKDIFENPIISYEKDEVTQIIYDDIDQFIYNKIAKWTVGELRNYILFHETSTSNLKELSRGLTSEMISGVSKLMSNMDLVSASQKMKYTAHCNTTIGEPGRLAFRC